MPASTQGLWRRTILDARVVPLSAHIGGWGGGEGRGIMHIGGWGGGEGRGIMHIGGWGGGEGRGIMVHVQRQTNV